MSEEVKVEAVQAEQPQDVMASTVHNPDDPVVSAKTSDTRFPVGIRR